MYKNTHPLSLKLESLNIVRCLSKEFVALLNYTSNEDIVPDR